MKTKLLKEKLGDAYEDTSLLTSYVPFTKGSDEMILSIHALSFGDDPSII